MPKSSPQQSRGPLVFGVAIGIVIAFWSGWMFVTLRHWNLSDSDGADLARFGQIGDTFGSLNTLFSGLAIAGVVYTLYRQHIDATEADLRHAGELEVQRDSARVVMLSSVLDYLRASLKALDQKAGKVRKLAGYRGHFHGQISPNSIFSHSMYHRTELGAAFFTLATQLLGDLRHKHWVQVEEAIDAFVPEELAKIEREIVDIERRIRETVTEADALTKTDKKLQHIARPG